MRCRCFVCRSKREGAFAFCVLGQRWDSGLLIWTFGRGED